MPPKAKAKAKRTLNPRDDSQPIDSKKRSKNEGSLETGNKQRVNVDDLNDGLFFKSRSEMNAEQRQRFEEYMEQQEKEEEQKRDEQWNAEKKFKKGIITMSTANQQPNGSSKKGFTVWCSEGDRYNEPHTKHFDSTWSSKADANERARYLFYWKNCWGFGAEEMHDTIHCTDAESNIDGLIQFLVEDEERCAWRVGVVPDIAFPYLDHSSTYRHNHDNCSNDRNDDTVTMGSIYGAYN
jgi:hypothetical protein